MNDARIRPDDSGSRPDDQTDMVVVRKGDLRAALSAVEAVYEAVVGLADVGLVDFAHLDDLPDALAYLRRVAR